MDVVLTVNLLTWLSNVLKLLPNVGKSPYIYIVPEYASCLFLHTWISVNVWVADAQRCHSPGDAKTGNPFKEGLVAIPRQHSSSAMPNPSRVHQDLRNHAFFIRIDLVMMWVKFAEEEGLFQYLIVCQKWEICIVMHWCICKCMDVWMYVCI